MNNYSAFSTCIEACLRCAAVCDHCAVSCLKEEHVAHMRRCIQLDMECSLMCTTAARLMSMGSEHAVAICTLCADICDACANECAQHDNEHCRMCAEQCRACAAECRKMNNN